MSTMTRFCRSCGLTSPNALPTIFSYWPTPGHENPRKVGGCERALSISIRVMRASAGDPANNAAASDAAKAMLKARIPRGAAKRRLMDDSSLWTPLPSGFFTSPERQRALGRCYARGFVGSTVKTSQPVRSPPAPARSPSFSVLIPLDQGQAVRVVADAGDGRDDRARAQVDDPHRPTRRSGGVETRPAGNHRVASVRSDRRALGAARKPIRTGNGNTRDFRARVMGEGPAEIDDRYVVRPVVRHDDLPPVGGPGERERPRLAGGIVRAHPHAGELRGVRGPSGEIDVDDGDRVPFEIDISPFPRGNGDQFAVRARLDAEGAGLHGNARRDRKSTRLNSSHTVISYAVFCLKKKKKKTVVLLHCMEVRTRSSA